jgi:hypothetical protein
MEELKRMNYVILIYHNPEAMAVWNSLSDEQRTRGLRVYAKLNEDLAASGELVATQALADRSLAKRVTVREGQTLATDGPFAEVKEELAGIYVVDCDGIERAVEIAARIPEARFGLVEVRPTMVYSQMEQ